MKKVIMYDSPISKTFFVGTETECLNWIMGQASDHLKYTKADGTEVTIIREIHDPDGIAYDVGVIYQIVEADGK